MLENIPQSISNFSIWHVFYLQSPLLEVTDFNWPNHTSVQNVAADSSVLGALIIGTPAQTMLLVLTLLRHWNEDYTSPLESCCLHTPSRFTLESSLIKYPTFSVCIMTSYIMYPRLTPSYTWHTMPPIILGSSFCFVLIWWADVPANRPHTTDRWTWL